MAALLIFILASPQLPAPQAAKLELPVTLKNTSSSSLVSKTPNTLLVVVATLAEPKVTVRLLNSICVTSPTPL